MKENSLINRMYNSAKDIIVYSLPLLGAAAILAMPGSLLYSQRSEAKKLNFEKIKTNQLFDEVDAKSNLIKSEVDRIYSDLEKKGVDYEPESTVPDSVILDKYGFSPEEIREHSRARGTEPHPLDDLVWEKITQGDQK